MGYPLFMLHDSKGLTPFYDWSLSKESLDQTKKEANWPPLILLIIAGS